MKVKVYSVFDSKVGSFMQPFFAMADGQAVRSFSDLAMDGQSGCSKHPGDFELHFIGEFDDESGELLQVEKPRYLARALDFVVAPVREVREAK